MKVIRYSLLCTGLYLGVIGSGFAGTMNQNISFVTVAPSSAVVGGAYSVEALASSHLPVDYTIDPSSTSICSVSGSILSFVAAGVCVLNANQAGDFDYAPALQLQQVVSVSNGPLLNSPTVRESFLYAAIEVGGTAQLTITLTNPNAATLTGVGYIDNYPNGIRSGAFAGSTCDGTVGVGRYDTLLSNGSIPPQSSCVVEIDVVAESIGRLTNYTGMVTSSNAPPAPGATAQLVVGKAPPPPPHCVPGVCM